MKKEYLRGVLAVVLAALLLTGAVSCFSGAQDDRSTAGVRDGILFSYLGDEQLLILSGKATIKASSRIFSLGFEDKVKYLFLTAGTDDIAPDAIGALTALEAVYCADGEEAFGDRLSGAPQVLYGVTDFETRTDLPFGHAVGHCPVNEENVCLLCKERWRYAYEDYRCKLLCEDRAVTGKVLVEGRELSFDRDGYLTVESASFMTLGGEKRYFDERGVMAIGQKDLDGYRYTFSNDGILTDERPLDASVPVIQILLPVLALFVGVGVCFGVYRFRKYKEKKEEEKER